MPTELRDDEITTEWLRPQAVAATDDDATDTGDAADDATDAADDDATDTGGEDATDTGGEDADGTDA